MAAPLAMMVAATGSGPAVGLADTPPPAAAEAADRGPSSAMVRVDGAGGGTLQSSSFAGDHVWFSVRSAAPSAKPWLAEGTFEVNHVRPDGTVLAHFGGDVNCLMSGSGVAVVTGTVTWRDGPGLPGLEISRQVGLTVLDQGRRDQLGWSWWVMGFRDAPHCLSTAPFFAITEGNFRVDSPHTAPRPPSPSSRNGGRSQLGAAAVDRPSSSTPDLLATPATSPVSHPR
jgi:hypothetical protein